MAYVYIGHIPDGSVLNNQEIDPLILGVESFFLRHGVTMSSVDFIKFTAAKIRQSKVYHEMCTPEIN